MKNINISKVSFENEDKALWLLKQIYSSDQFREGQKEIIDKFSASKDFIAPLPTSDGKSVIFGITVVVQPLNFFTEELI